MLLWLVFLLGSEKPMALQALEEARSAMVKADVYWSDTSLRGTFAGEPFFFRTRAAGGDLAFTRLGNPEGMVSITEQGQPGGFSPRSTLVQSDAQWNLEQGTIFVKKYEVRPPSTDALDVRAIGMLPFPEIDWPMEERIASFPSKDIRDREYTQRQEDGVYIVEMKAGQTSVVWHIDPQLGWNCTLCEMFNRGERTAYCVTDYQKCNGAWLPITSAYFDEKGEMTRLLEVQSATVNDARLPDKLLPSHIGIEPGMQVTIHNGPRRGAMLMWNGQDAVSRETFRQEFKEGTVKNGPAVQEFLRRLHAEPELGSVGRSTSKAASKPASAAASKPHDTWDDYVESFISRYHLHTDQVAKAQSILADCKAQRERCVNLIAIQQKEAKPDPRRIEKLMGTIDAIFENALKPRLDRLLTRKQRADAAAETQPAKP